MLTCVVGYTGELPFHANTVNMDLLLVRLSPDGCLLYVHVKVCIGGE